MPNQSQIVLASASKSRAKLMKQLQIAFDIVPANIDETPLPQESAHEMVLRLATQKGQVVSERYPANAIIISSDQAAVLNEGLSNERIFGKPQSIDHAASQLSTFSGQTLTFLTSLSVSCQTMDYHKTLVEPYYVEFRQLTDNDISDYLSKENPLSCAGSFKSEGLGVTLINRYRGQDPSALLGLPLIALCRILRTLRQHA